VFSLFASILFVLIVAAGVCWLVNVWMPGDSRFKATIHGLVGFFVLIWLLSVLGVFRFPIRP
jgi:hypothetical protein